MGRCKYCKWLDREIPQDKRKKSAFGRCRRYPPMAQINYLSMAIYPRISEIDYCGEFEAKKECEHEWVSAVNNETIQLPDIEAKDP